MRGVVGRPASASVFDIVRWAPSGDAAAFVEHFWSVTWDLRAKAPFGSTVITFPSIHITHEWGEDSPRHGFPLPASLTRPISSTISTRCWAVHPANTPPRTATERHAAAVDTSEIAFAGAAEQARLLAAGIVSAPQLLARGVYDDVQTLPRPERLEARTRAFARVGRLVSDARMRRIRASESIVAERILSVFDKSDVVLTPGSARGPSRIGQYRRRGAVATLALVAARVPFQAMFNVTGQPAAVVPWGSDEHGVPTSVQLVGRPFDEATLLSLSAQIEKGRPWAHRRPPLA